jgi:hypothetical protein
MVSYHIKTRRISPEDRDPENLKSRICPMELISTYVSIRFDLRVSVSTLKPGTGDTCFLASINHHMQEHVTGFNMGPFFVASLSRLHRDAPDVTAVETFRYVHQPSQVTLTPFALTELLRSMLSSMN